MFGNWSSQGGTAWRRGLRQQHSAPPDWSQGSSQLDGRNEQCGFCFRRRALAIFLNKRVLKIGLTILMIAPELR